MTSSNESMIKVYQKPLRIIISPFGQFHHKGLLNPYEKNNEGSITSGKYLELTLSNSNQLQYNCNYRVENPIKSVGVCLDLMGCRASTIEIVLQGDNHHKNGIVEESLL